MGLKRMEISSRGWYAGIISTWFGFIMCILKKRSDYASDDFLQKLGDGYGGDFGGADISAIPKPDAVFLGGYGGKMEQLLDKVNTVLADGGIIGFNAVSDTSLGQFAAWAESNGYQQQPSSTIKVDEHNAITVVVVSKKLNGS